MLKLIAASLLLTATPSAAPNTYSTWDDNGFCWTNCPQLDAGAYIQSFTQIRGLSGYKALPEVVNGPTQIRGLRVGINNMYGNFWRATGTLIHSSGTRYPIHQGASTDGNPMGYYNTRCSEKNICQPTFEWGPLSISDKMYAGSYSLELQVTYAYGLNPGWAKTITLAPALIIASSPAGTGPVPPTTTTVAPTAPTTTVAAAPRRGEPCPYERGVSGRLVCKRVGNVLKWARRQ